MWCIIPLALLASIIICDLDIVIMLPYKSDNYVLM